VGYGVELPQSVREYLASVAGLTDEGRAAIVDGAVAELSASADYFLEKYPLGHESLSFLYDYFHPTSGTLFNFEFVVDASAREMGVMRAVYVECTTEPMRDAE
jgi:hypothetical protein